MKATLALLVALAAGTPADPGPQYDVAFEYRQADGQVHGASMVANAYTNTSSSVREDAYVARSCDATQATTSAITLKSGVRIEHRMVGTVLHLTVIEYRADGALDPGHSTAACVSAQPQQVVFGPFNVTVDLSESTSHRVNLDATRMLTLQTRLQPP